MAVKYKCWKLDTKTQFLRHKHEFYYVNLRDLHTPGDVLSALFQLSRKPWCTGADAIELVKYVRDEMHGEHLTYQSGDQPAGRG